MSLMSTGMSICSISSTCKKLLILHLIAISIVLFVYHLIIFPVLTVKENPVRAFLPVVFIVTLSTLRALLKAAKIVPSHFVLFLSKNFVQPGGNLTPL